MDAGVEWEQKRASWGSQEEEGALDLDLKESGGMGRRPLHRPCGAWAREELLVFGFPDARANSTKEDILSDDLSLLFVFIIIYWSITLNFIVCAKT